MSGKLKTNLLCFYGSAVFIIGLFLFCNALFDLSFTNYQQGSTLHHLLICDEKMNPFPYFIQAMPLVAFIGTYLLIIAYDKSKIVERVMSKGLKAEGTVVEIRQDPGLLFGSGESKGSAPVVDFVFPNGSHRHYSTHYQTPTPYYVGQKVEVRYYFYKSIREVLLADEDAGTLPKTLFRWGLVMCLLGYPFLLRKLLLLGNLARKQPLTHLQINSAKE